MCGHPTSLRYLCVAIKNPYGPYLWSFKTLEVLVCGHPASLRSLHTPTPLIRLYAPNKRTEPISPLNREMQEEGSVRG
jgi:hypothetical protein